jgi:26S proteasome regulatory subunit N9
VETSKEAHVLLLATISHAKLLYGDLDGTKTDMDAAWKILDHLSGVDNGVNAAYYGVAADYYKVNCALLPIVREGNRSLGSHRPRQSIRPITGTRYCTLLA